MKKFKVFFVVIAAFLFTATSAYAIPADPPDGSYAEYMGLFLTDDTGASVLVTSSTGMAAFNGVVGDWSVNVTTLLSYPVLGSTSAPVIDLNTVNVTSSTGGTLNIWASVTGFDFPAPGAGFNLDVGGTTNGTVQFAGFWDNEPGYLFWANFAPLFVSDVISTSPFAVSFSGAIPDPETTAYTLFAEIIHTGAGATSFDAEFTVPEPTSLILLGLGLLGMAAIRRKH